MYRKKHHLQQMVLEKLSVRVPKNEDRAASITLCINYFKLIKDLMKPKHKLLENTHTQRERGNTLCDRDVGKDFVNRNLFL